MSQARDQAERTRIELGILEAAGRAGPISQRQLATDLGIALGLANAYVKRCMKKGLLKVSQVPARRYSYYLTPEGFAEKSRLTADYLSFSFTFFRQARMDCAHLFDEVRAKGWTRVALVGRSEVAEIAVLCATESGVEVEAIVDSSDSTTRFLGRVVLPDFTGLDDTVDGLIVTAITDHHAAVDAAVAAFGPGRVLVPALLAPKTRGRR